MLETLRRIVQEVNKAKDLTQVLNIIVTRVKQAMAVDVCSVYLVDAAHQQHVLMATDGLNPNAVGQVRFAHHEGLVGLVAESEEPLNLDNAPDHSRYLFVFETDEQQYHGFLGVPIIHHRKLLGVLVVRQRERRLFDEDGVAFLVTMAAQLSGAIAHAEASGDIDNLYGEDADYTRPVKGLPGAAGVALGTAVVVFPSAQLDKIPDRRVSDIASEVKAFETAVEAARAEIRALRSRIGSALNAEDNALFDAYVMMLSSKSLVNNTIARIRAGNWASGSLRETIHELASVFDEMDDPYLRERANDMRDLGQRILACLQKGPRKPREYPQQTILVGEEITATMLAEVPSQQLVGVVSVRGTSSSHVAILANALGIPAVVGASDLPVARVEGRELILDGYQGHVFLSTSKLVRDEYTRLAQAEAELIAGLEELRDLPAQTIDGTRIPLYANTGLLADISPSINCNAEGIGLYRTEFPFMVRDRFPGEEEQRQVYHRVLAAYAPRLVTLRTLDIGGDKVLPYFPIVEDNPFLGWRGIRITLDHPEIFLVQLRAMLRASVGLDNLQLLFPMVTSVSEIDDALALLQRAYQELLQAGEQIAQPRVGVMVEVPAAVYQAEALARRVDFLSIGSNDLTQYILAVDRNNARVAALYDPLHPAVLQALKQVIDSAHQHGKPVSVCGEMASDPAAVVLLLGLGVDSLSMSAAALLRIKWVIRTMAIADLRVIAQEVLQLEDASAVHARLRSVLKEAGLGILVRSEVDAG